MSLTRKRALIARIFCAGLVFLLGMGIPKTSGPAFASPEAREKASGRTLTFADRVAYQQAIEDVYWRHRIWPKENPGPKPLLDAIISQRQIEQKVEDYLHKSQLVAGQRGTSIAASELQAEMDRMAQHTKQPEVLHELFAALGNDALVIAECLIRPILAERLVTGPTVVRARTNLSNAAYKLPEISTGCSDDTWTATTTVSAPDARFDHTAIWTGSEMIVWGGLGSGGVVFDTGGRYNPATDSWIATSTTNAPAGRVQFTAVWTGSETIVWGGLGCGSNCRLNTGGRYNPTTDSWAATNTVNAPEARWYHSAVWTGSEMVVWGGTNQTIYLNTGAKYNPSDNSWTATTSASAPLGRVGHSTIWSGSEMIVWAGTDSTFNDTNIGGRYDPVDDSWEATSAANPLHARDSHTAVWTGTEMIVWGGAFCYPCMDFNDGGRYDPATDSWAPISTADAPLARFYHTAVWTGGEMIVWGGHNNETGVSLNTGGRYCAQSTATPTPTPTVTPTPTATPTVTDTPTATATSTPRATPTPRIAPTPRSRPTPLPRP